MKPFKYAEGRAPEGYECSQCHCAQRKLWRQYQTFGHHIRLLCGACALKDQKQAGPIDEQGFRLSETGRRRCYIGGLVPAVPTEDGETFWGYMAMPSDGVVWWRNLPTQ